MSIVVGDIIYTAPRVWERPHLWKAYKIVGETKSLWKLGSGDTVNKKTMLEAGRVQHGYGRSRFYTKAEKDDLEFCQAHKSDVASYVYAANADQLRAIAAILGKELK